MKIPDPYFKNIPYIGNLRMDYIIYEYDYPVLFLCKSDRGMYYLCDCCDTIKEQRWLIAPISVQEIGALLNNAVTIREIFEKAEGLCCVATWIFGDRHEKYELISAGDFDPEDLPEAGALVEAEGNEYNDYLESIKNDMEYNAQLELERKISFPKVSESGRDMDSQSLKYQFCLKLPSNQTGFSGTTNSSSTSSISVVTSTKSFQENRELAATADWFAVYAA